MNKHKHKPTNYKQTRSVFNSFRGQASVLQARSISKEQSKTFFQKIAAFIASIKNKIFKR